MALLTTACAFAFFLLALRSILLGVGERKVIALRALDFILAIFFLVSGVAIKSVSPIVYSIGSLFIFLVLVVFLLPGAIRRVNTTYRSRPWLATMKILFVVCLLIFSVVLLMTLGFLRFLEDQPVLKVTMTGINKLQDVEWKPPEYPLQHQKLHSYEVVLNQPNGQPVSQVFLYGDQVAIKAKVIRFRPTLSVFGVRNLCRIEYVFNGYTTAQRHNFYPHHAVEIFLTSPALKPWQEWFWGYWEKVYYQKSSNPLIKSATLESTFFPLVDPNGRPFRGSYYLTINAGGLSGMRAGD